MALAVVPLILAEGAGAAARQAMGLVIFAGLLIGTSFTLFVVPMFYTFISPSDKAWRAAREKKLAAG
jgi:multidrug efflux pump